MTNCWRGGLRVGNRRSPALVRLLLAAIGLCCLTACRPAAGPSAFELVIGGAGRGQRPGEFNRPRGLCADPARGLLYVVDWDGRIQVFTRDGQFRGSWVMPEVAKGKPEGLCVTADGRVLVADTHYSQVLCFVPGGEVLWRFGEYGEGPGQFIYPVAITVDDQGRIYVAEYGGQDRVQQFTPEGRFLRSWGRLGSAPGEFQRPSGLTWLPTGELVVADAVNHRLQVFDGEGRLRRIIGAPGKGPGQFHYPYDVSFFDGALYVIEYGGQRVQKLSLAGEPLAILAEGGRPAGALAGPWKLHASALGLFVSDTNNHRVVRLRP